MSKNRIENSLHREIEQLRKSIETLASFPDIDLAELYVAKKCAARILGVCYRIWSDGIIRDISIASV